MDVDELRVTKVAKQLHESIIDGIQLLGRQQDTRHNLKRVLEDLPQFQPCPHLLDPYLDSFIHLILEEYTIDPENGSITEVFYNLGKIVTPKKLLNFFPTNVELLPKLTLEFSSLVHWHRQYLLLCWLTVLVLAPFQIEKFGQDIKEDLYNIGVDKLGKSGPLQPLGARLVGSLIMRHDCSDLWTKFIDNLLQNFEESDDALQEGLLLALNVAMHKDSYGTILRDLNKVSPFFSLLLSQTSHVGIIAKLLSKFMTILMQLEEDDWETIEGIVNWFQDSFHSKSNDTRFILARQYGKLITRVDDCMGIDLMLDALSSTRELFSKESFETIDTDILHSRLLCLAEFLRMNLMNHQEFQEILDILQRTLFFQQPRITFVAGSNIRDASNYIAWSLAKYSKRQLDSQIVKGLFTFLLLVCCFDKEILIRRSATSAIQELIGRHGVRTWVELYPNDETNHSKSIRLIEALDYVDLGSIDKSYLEIPQKVLEIFPDLKPTFIKFLIKNIENVDFELVKYSSKALKVLLTTENETCKDQTVRHIIKNADIKPFNSFTALAELIPLLQSRDSIQDITPVFRSIKIDHHKDTQFAMLSYLSLLNSLLNLELQCDDQILENVFSAIRVDNHDVCQILKEVAPKIHIQEKYWTKWYHYMKLGNLNTASSVTYLPCFPEKTNDIACLLESEKTDCNVKAAIVNSVSEYLKSGQMLQESFMQCVLNELDDYAISEQGDVGSKVRLACLKLVQNNLENLPQPTLELKLLRLSSEPIDKLRNLSTELLQRLYNTNEVDTSSRSHFDYFSELLKFFKTHWMNSKDSRIEFFRGYIFSCGALKATDALISDSLRAFCDFYTSIEPALQKEILLNIASLIKPIPGINKRMDFKSQHLSKQILVGMQFYTRILLANIPIPEDFNLDGLYVRIYNLHLGTTNITRLQCAIKMFGYFYLRSEMLKAKLTLISIMTTHRVARVRAIAADELFMVYSEKLSITGNEKYTKAMEVIHEFDWTSNDRQPDYTLIDV